MVDIPTLYGPREIKFRKVNQTLYEDGFDWVELCLVRNRTVHILSITLNGKQHK